MEFIDMIPNIVKGFGIKPKDIVLLNFWGEIEDFNILNKFSLEISKGGGIPIPWQESRRYMKDYFTEVSEEHLVFPEEYFNIFGAIDVVVDIFTYTILPSHDFPMDKRNSYKEYLASLFKALSSNSKKFIQVRIPTEEISISEDVEYNLFKESLNKAFDVDYHIMGKNADVLIEKMGTASRIAVFSGDSSMLTFSIEGRKWYKDLGDGDVPCGEIYIAPVEESAEGDVFIQQFYLEGKLFNDVLLHFSRGKLIECSEDEIIEFIREFPGDCDIIGEFGIGVNYKIERVIGYAVHDEKIKGTVHIAVGMNEMFGGKNKSPLHLDFIFKPHKILADGKEVEI